MYITMDHFYTPTTKQPNPHRLPSTQPLSCPQVLPVFASTSHNASPVIQVHLPGSLDAILFLAIATFDYYFPAALFITSADPQPALCLESLTLGLYSRCP